MSLNPMATTSHRPHFRCCRKIHQHLIETSFSVRENTTGPSLRRGLNFRSHGPVGRVLSAAGGDQNIRFVMCNHNGSMCARCQCSLLMALRLPYLFQQLRVTLTLCDSIFLLLQVISPFHIYYNYRLIVQRRELWRLVSNFFYFGNFGKPVSRRNDALCWCSRRVWQRYLLYCISVPRLKRGVAFVLAFVRVVSQCM